MCRAYGSGASRYIRLCYRTGRPGSHISWPEGAADPRDGGSCVRTGRRREPSQQETVGGTAWQDGFGAWVCAECDRSWATQRAAEQCHSKGGARQRNRKELICE